MRFLLAFENPWCLFSLLLTIALLLIAAALQSYSRARSRPAVSEAAPRPVREDRDPQITTTAPYEALLAIHERLADMQRHLSPESNDARWLQSYRNDLRNVLDDVYWELHHTPEAQKSSLLERLNVEVAQLNQTIGAHISARIGHTADRDALRRQLDRLRDVVGE